MECRKDEARLFLLFPSGGVRRNKFQVSPELWKALLYCLSD